MQSFHKTMDPHRPVQSLVWGNLFNCKHGESYALIHSKIRRAKELANPCIS